MQVTLVFPHQLFEQHPALKERQLVCLYEDPLFFTQYKFHRRKLILHRASMKSYAASLERAGHQVAYFDVVTHPGLDTVFELLAKQNVREIHYADPADYLVERRLKRMAARFSIALVPHRSPGFMLDHEEFRNAAGNGKKFLMANFYIRQRRKYRILVHDNDEPIGGKWSFDSENRKRIPRNTAVPRIAFPEENDAVNEARTYVARHFSDCPGNDENFCYPVNHDQAVRWLDDFLVNRLNGFGDYEDAIVANEAFLFHSVLTPALNTGLLTPTQVVSRTLELNEEYKFPLNSLEGFLRQIIGWREFMHGLYLEEGVRMRKGNYLEYSTPIPEAFYKGETGIDPVDHTIRKVQETAYAHHIERLMILGNFMNLCGFHPDAVYRWFMEMFIDAYDWVMVPNVYGMSQYAAGNLMTTKPYVSGSNYVLKMSNFKKGNWCGIWDALYWRYLIIHEERFSNNPRMTMVYRLLEKMEAAKRNKHLHVAENFLATL